MTTNWDEYWNLSPVSTPSVEPAYAFVTQVIAREFGGLKGIRVIELGAGRGDISFLLAKAGAKVTLLDNSEVALRQSRALFQTNNLSAEFVQADLLSSRITGEFEVSMSFGLAEHFEGVHRKRVIQLHRLGRVAFVGVPNAQCVPYRVWKTFREWSGRWPYGPEMPFTRRELKQEICRSFKRVEVFSTPLSHNLNRKIGLPPSVHWPFDTFLAYQLVGCGIN